MSALLWFRRDLRVHDNPALAEALRLGATKAVYISAPVQWRKHGVAPIQVDFVQRHLGLIAQQLAELGITLYHLKATDFHNQTELLQDFCKQESIEQICVNDELEINEQKRDRMLERAGIQLKRFQCDTILPYGAVLNKQGKMFHVFTPFKNAWLKQLVEKGGACTPTPEGHGTVAPSRLEVLEFTSDYPFADSSKWPLSDAVMSRVVPEFMESKLAKYGRDRDYPAIKATSGLSPYLAIGAISPRWLVTQLLQHQPDIVVDTSLASFSWLNELIWRDFYKHLLFHYPDLVKGESFNPNYRSTVWPNNPEHFKAWCEGRTGYPLVDAAMRQLVETGWMHNRLRMVVASFLTKHLLIDWRLGEAFFMSHLIDGDFSANNGGWQWAASTGCDAMPYFRIFNPITQSKKFDSQGQFIRRYVHELSDIPNKEIHFPHSYLLSRGEKERYYPPLVDHKAARERALSFYKQIK